MSTKAKSKKTGVETSFTEKQWDKIQKEQIWHGVFIPVKESTPKELKEFEAKRKVQREKPEATEAPAKAKETINQNRSELNSHKSFF